MARIARSGSNGSFRCSEAFPVGDMIVSAAAADVVEADFVAKRWGILEDQATVRLTLGQNLF